MNLVTTVKIEDTYLSMLRDIQPDLTIHCCENEQAAAPYLPHADIVIADNRSFGLLTLERAPRLKWLQSLTAGVDKMPLAELEKRGVRVTNTKGMHKIQMSEYALGMMLEHARNRSYYRGLQNSKVWEKAFIGDELYGKTVGIVGIGSIGEEIARKCKAFDMNVIGLNRSGKAVPFVDAVLTYAGMNQLLETSDYIIVLLPITKETRDLIGGAEFQRMKPTCYFISMGRGGVVNEDALIEALQTGKIGGAALDVFETEPLPPTSPLWNMDRVIVTPHHAGATRHYKARAFEIICKNFRFFVEGKPLLNVVNAEAGY